MTAWRHAKAAWRTALGGAGALLALMPLAFAQDAQQAGVSAAVRGAVEISRLPEAVGRQVASGEPIYLRDRIRSGADSGMQVLLLDETVFTIGPQSELIIDQFVYDPERSAGKVSATVAKGVFRFVTGRVANRNPDDMTVRTPAGTIGIRGTIVAAEVCPVWPGQPMTAHWGIPDPAAVTGTNAEKRAAFADAYRMLLNRISIFVALPLASLDRLTLQRRLSAIGEGAPAAQPA